MIVKVGKIIFAISLYFIFYLAFKDRNTWLWDTLLVGSFTQVCFSLQYISTWHNLKQSHIYLWRVYVKPFWKLMLVGYLVAIAMVFMFLEALPLIVALWLLIAFYFLNYLTSYIDYQNVEERKTLQDRRKNKISDLFNLPKQY